MLAKAKAMYGQLPATEDLLGAWAIRHGAWLLNRYVQHKPGNQTSFELMFERGYRGALLVFGETCMVRLDPERLAHKFAQRWVKGLWVGYDDLSNSNLVLCPSGVVTSRSVRRLPPDAQSDPVAFDEACGAPWSFVEDARVGLRTAREQRAAREQGEQQMADQTQQQEATTGS